MPPPETETFPVQLCPKSDRDKKLIGSRRIFDTQLHSLIEDTQVLLWVLNKNV